MDKVMEKPILPVDIVFHPSWWNAHAGMTFDEDFFYHPKKRVESERKMEQVLYDRFGRHGLGENRHENLPVIGAVHNASGYLVSEMLGCGIRYNENAAPDVYSCNTCGGWRVSYHIPNVIVCGSLSTDYDRGSIVDRSHRFVAG